ncbi:MAG: sigma-70 family RNA polymerase sigma factor [Firmicutes bacterium]|nr:sigma-70 family RNA polymerase sigma factor [Bacillota bacterium]
MLNDQLEQIYSKYYREVFLYAFSLCQNQQQADDLTSETFFKALLSLDEGTPYIKYWLFRVCKNLYLDSARKKQKYATPDSLATIPSNKADPLDQIIENEQNKLIYTQIMKLRPSYREIIILFYYGGLSLKEIASTTGLTEGAAKVLLHRARKKLKAILEDKNEF